MNSLFITYKNDEWCHFVVRIGSPALISFFAHVVSFYFSLPFLSFSIFCGVYYFLRYWDKFFNTSDKAVELFIASYIEL